MFPCGLAVKVDLYTFVLDSLHRRHTYNTSFLHFSLHVYVCVCVCVSRGGVGGGGEEVDPWRRGRQKCFGGQLGGSEINTA